MVLEECSLSYDSLSLWTYTLVFNTSISFQNVTLIKSGGPMGLSIIGGSDHSCVPFGTGDPGIFISKVRQISTLNQESRIDQL